MTIKVAIVEDEEDIRSSLEVLLSEHEEIYITGSYGSGEAALAGLEEELPDVLMCDINLPGISGIEVIARVKQHHPGMQCMVLSSYDDADYIFKALRAGATGYILKNTPTEHLIISIKDIYNGGSPMTSQIARKVVTAFSSMNQAVYCEQLSRRENEILDLLAKGFRYKEIASQFFISPDTVKTHIRNIYEKLQVNSRAEALRKAGHR